MGAVVALGRAVVGKSAFAVRLVIEAALAMGTIVAAEVALGRAVVVKSAFAVRLVIEATLVMGAVIAVEIALGRAVAVESALTVGLAVEAALALRSIFKPAFSGLFAESAFAVGLIFAGIIALLEGSPWGRRFS